METKESCILIVDDSKENIDLLVEIVEKNYEALVAIDGESALEIAIEEVPDLILLDIVMPDMDGYSVCQRLKESEITKDIPIIFVTAKDDVSNETQGLMLGAIDYLTKPIVPEIVTARIKNHLELKKTRQLLQKQNEQLKKMIQMREELSDMIIHDIRSPLGSILGACEWILDEGLNEDTLSFVKDIQERAEYATSFSDDLLMLAKAKENQLILNFSQVNIGEIIHLTIKNYLFISQAKSIRFVTELPEEGQFVSIDKNLFKRVIDNLISNSIKYSPSNSEIGIKLKIDGDHFHLQICDCGMGISPENKEKIFDKFKIAKMNQQGINQVGLGLAFCKVVTDAHNGKIYVTDNNPGSIFHIEI